MMSLGPSEVSGACLCREIRFTGQLKSPHVTACHCSQCRIWSGHVWAAFHLLTPRIEGPVRWFQSSDIAERGFCPTCGSSLFWRLKGSDTVAIAAGAVSNPSQLRLAEHIYVADKGDYYDILGDLPSFAQDGPTVGEN